MRPGDGEVADRVDPADRQHGDSRQQERCEPQQRTTERNALEGMQRRAAGHPQAQQEAAENQWQRGRDAVEVGTAEGAAFVRTDVLDGRPVEQQAQPARPATGAATPLSSSSQPSGLGGRGCAGMRSRAVTDAASARAVPGSRQMPMLSAPSAVSIPATAVPSHSSATPTGPAGRSAACSAAPSPTASNAVKPSAWKKSAPALSAGGLSVPNG